MLLKYGIMLDIILRQAVKIQYPEFRILVERLGGSYMLNISITQFDRTDLCVYQCGMEQCTSGHYYGPALRDHFLIHYVKSGKGKFQVGDMTYHLSKGQGFLIYPNVITFYQADFIDPWQYTWIGFNGTKAEAYLKQGGLTLSQPIFTYSQDELIENCFDDMVKAHSMRNGREIRLLGQLHIFLSQLIEVNPNSLLPENHLDRRVAYIRKALDYIEMNYSRKISINELASHVGLDRSYFGSIFREITNVTPQQYLINHRIGKACSLLDNTNFSIGDISRSVGYDDPLLFSRMFKQERGMSPVNYRKITN